MSNDTIVETIRKISRLMDDPGATEGEKENARKKLELFLRKYGYTEADISDANTKISMFQFDFDNKYEATLLSQIIFQTLNVGKISYWHGHLTKKGDLVIEKKDRAKHIVIEMTRIQYDTVKERYWQLRKPFDDELQLATRAFISSNKIYSNLEQDQTELSLDEIDQIKKVLKRAMLIQPTPLPFKMIEA